MYDIIGDIHGHADDLEILLQKMGYVRKFGVYSHPEKRKVAFVGDFIDRGPKIRETLHLVKDMCDSDNAIAVMGNHEYNAICFHTEHTERGGFFRNHSVKEIEQHIETLEQFKHYPKEWKYFLEWFKTIPLYFENEHFRMVHACWDDKHINWLNENYKGMTSEFLTQASNRNKPGGAFYAVEETLKGKESTLPNGEKFKDKGGVERTEARVKWWAPSENRKTLGELIVDCPEKIRDIKIVDTNTFHSYSDSKPVFFGHYWLKDTPVVENPQAICLDYSVAKNGKLVAFRLNNENIISNKNFIY